MLAAKIARSVGYLRDGALRRYRPGHWTAACASQCAAARVTRLMRE